MATNTGAQGRQVNAFDLASLYLRTAGLPDTQLNRRMLAAWFMAESKRVGKTDIIVYNNNPLNIRPEGSNQPYHTFTGVPGKFASYSGTTAGAQAWAEFLKRNKYNGIISAFKYSDVQAMRAALAGKPHWGTGANLYYSVFKELPADGSTGTNLGDSSSFKGINDSGSIDATLASDTSTTQDYLATMFEQYRKENGIDPNSKVTQAQFDNFITAWLPQKNAALATALQEGTGTSGGGFWAQMTRNALANGVTWAELTKAHNAYSSPYENAAKAPDPLAAIGNFFDPAKWPARMLHIGAILAGTGMVFYGLKIIISNAGVDGVSAGANSAHTIVRERYPAIIDSSEVDDESDDLVEDAEKVVEKPVQRARRTSRANKPSDAEQAELLRMSRDAQNENKGNASRSRTEAPLKSETGAA